MKDILSTETTEKHEAIMEQRPDQNNMQTIPSSHPQEHTDPSRARSGKNSGYKVISILLALFLFFCATGGGLYYLNRKGYVDIPFLTSTSTRTKKYHKSQDEKSKIRNLFSEIHDSKPSSPSPSAEGDDPEDAGSAGSIDFDFSETDEIDPDEPVFTDDNANHQNSNPSGDLSGKFIILDPGHGGRDTGCVFPFNNPNYWECNFTLHIVEKLKAQLESRGATVYVTRSDNSWVSLYNRLAQTHLICMDIAEKQGKLPFSAEHAEELRQSLRESIEINEDTVASGGMGLMVGSGAGPELQELMEMEKSLDNVLFLSVHLNSSESRTLHGTQIYYVTDESVIESENRQMRTNSEFKRSDFPKRDPYYGRNNEKNSLLAECLYDNIVGDIPEFETNAHPTVADNYAVLREHGLTGALIETAFLSDDNDRGMLCDENIILQIADSISNGVEIYYANVSD